MNPSNSIRKNSAAVMGLQLGDEGKGRIVDNIIKNYLTNKKLSKIYVIRCQGGNNAGHTVEKDNVRLGLHQLPSGVFYDEAIEVLDAGMVLNVEDLLDEIDYVEEKVGKFSDRVILSGDAMLNTDLHRAKEVLNRTLSGNAKGGTGRGIGPTTAEYYDKTGLFVKNLVADDWKEVLNKKYENMQKLFNAYDMELKDIDVPDFNQTKLQQKSCTRKIGTKKEFLARLEETRHRLLEKNIVKDTFLLHEKIFNDEKAGVIFELAQAAGLDPWFGTRGDMTTTPTTSFAILYGTRYWKPTNIEQTIGILKATYMSSVGARTMPTQVNNEWAQWVRDTAHEYGTTTSRPRDICYIDLPFLKYNTFVSGISHAGFTHLDIARENENIKVCTHYEINGKKVPYKPEGYTEDQPRKTNYFVWEEVT